MAMKNTAFSDVLGLVWWKFPGVMEESLYLHFQDRKVRKKVDVLLSAFAFSYLYLKYY